MHLKHLKKEHLTVQPCPSCTRNRSSFARPCDLHKITVLDQALEVARDIYPTIRECRESSSRWEEDFWDAYETHQRVNFYQRTTDVFYHSLVCCQHYMSSISVLRDAGFTIAQTIALISGRNSFS